MSYLFGGLSYIGSELKLFRLSMHVQMSFIIVSPKSIE